MSSRTWVTVATTLGSLLWGAPTSAVGALSVSGTIRISLRCTAGHRTSVALAVLERGCRRHSSLGAHRLPRQTHRVQQAHDSMHIFTVVRATLVECPGLPSPESDGQRVRLRERLPSWFGWR